MANIPYITTSAVDFTVPSPALIGNATTSYVGFYGTTPIVRPSSALQVAVGTAAATGTTAKGYATHTQADAIVTHLNEVIRVMTALGLWKGGA